MTSTLEPASPSTSLKILEKFVSDAKELYTMPAVAMRVLDLTEKPQVDTAALKECIEQDPALTCKVLQAVNSSLFGLSNKVVDLGQSISLLGTTPLKLLVLGFSLPENLFEKLEAQWLQQYWTHTLHKAVLARELSTLIWGVNGDEAFISGVLEDLGQLVLLQKIGEPYAHFLEQVAGEAEDLDLLEETALGFHHRNLTHRLLLCWGIPAKIADVVDVRRNVEEINGLREEIRPLAQILHLSELLTRLLTQQRVALLAKVFEVRKQYRHFEEQQIDQVLEQSQEKVAQLAEVFSVKLSDKTDYNILISRAHRQLSQVAAQAAEELLHQHHSTTSSHDSAGLGNPSPGDGSTDELSGNATVGGGGNPEESGFARSKLAQSTNLLRQHIEKIEGLSSGSSGAGISAKATSSAGISHKTSPSHSKQTSRAKSGSITTRDTLPENSGLLGRLSAEVLTARGSRHHLSLVLFAIDEYDAIILMHGLSRSEYLLHITRKVCDNLDAPGQNCYLLDDNRLALVLPNFDRQQAVQWAGETVRNMPELFDKCLPGNGTATLSAGIASVGVPPKNFPPTDLFESAQRCLNGAILSTGHTANSISVF